MMNRKSTSWLAVLLAMLLLSISGQQLHSTAGNDTANSARPSGAPTLPGKQSYEFNYVVNDEPFRVQLYRSMVSDKPTMLMWPVLAFKADRTGNLVVDYEKPLLSGKAKVAIYLMITPPAIHRAAEARLALRQANQEGSGTMPIISVLIRNLVIEEFADQSQVVFSPVRLEGETNAPTVRLVAELEDEDAKAAAEALRSGQANVTFRVRANLYAQRERAAMAVDARIVKAIDTEAGTQLVGTGGQSTTSTKDGTVTQTSAPVTRKQRKDVSADLKEQIALKLQISGHPTRSEILNAQIDKWLNEQVFGPTRVIDLTVENLEKLNPIGFHPNDLKPDVIEKFTTDVKDFLSDDARTHTSFSAGGSGWGFSANVSYSKDEVRKRLIDRGWTLEQDGKKYIPKSIEVQDVNTRAIKAHNGFSATITENDYGTVIFDQQVSTRARLAPDQAIEQLVTDYEALKAQVAALTTKQINLASRVTTAEKNVAATPVWQVKRVEIDGSGWHWGRKATKDVDFGKPVLEAFAVPYSLKWLNDGRGPLPKGGRGVRDLYCDLDANVLKEKPNIVRTTVLFHLSDYIVGSQAGGVSFVVIARTR